MKAVVLVKADRYARAETRKLFIGRGGLTRRAMRELDLFVLIESAFRAGYTAHEDVVIGGIVKYVKDLKRKENKNEQQQTQ